MPIPRRPRGTPRLAGTAAGGMVATAAVLLRRGCAGRRPGPWFADRRGLLPPPPVSGEVPRRPVPARLDVRQDLVRGPAALRLAVCGHAGTVRGSGRR